MLLQRAQAAAPQDICLRRVGHELNRQSLECKVFGGINDSQWRVEARIMDACHEQA